MPIRLVVSTLSTILTVVALLLLASVRAEAVSVRDIIELSRAGLSEEVLVALIEVDDTPFSLDARRLLELRAAGVSDRVLLAMLRSGRVKSPETAAVHPVAPVVTPALPAVVVVEDRRTPQPRAYPVLIPVLIPVPAGVPLVGSRHVSRRSRVISFGREVAGRRSHKPVGWGWGGTRRPDTWAEARRVQDHHVP